MLKGQVAKSNNGIDRAKYITFGVPADDLAVARPRLERVEADVMGNFKRLGVVSSPLDGRERLAVLHGQTHPGPQHEPFRFSWKDIVQTGQGTKEAVYNLKQMAAALMYLQENGLTDYDALESKTETAVDRAHTLARELRAVEDQLTTTSELMGPW